jgi:hypothetical protein
LRGSALAGSAVNVPTSNVEITHSQVDPVGRWLKIHWGVPDEACPNSLGQFLKQDLIRVTLLSVDHGG